MHEGAIAAAIIQNALEVLEREKLASARAVTVLIGRLHHVVPDVLQNHFRPEFLNRLDDILRSRPRAIFLLIGTNDLPWFTYRKDAEILKNYNQILERCGEISPDTKVFVQSILPRGKSFAQRIRRINTELEALAARHGYAFINLYPSFVGADGAIQDQITNDHLHLMAEGYARWVEILKPHIEDLLAQNKSSN